MVTSVVKYGIPEAVLLRYLQQRFGYDATGNPLFHYVVGLQTLLFVQGLFHINDNHAKAVRMSGRDLWRVTASDFISEVGYCPTRCKKCEIRLNIGLGRSVRYAR